VDFRSKDFIGFQKERKFVPLIWLHNVECMKIKWPLINGSKGKPKGQYIMDSEKSLSRLVPNMNYVLLRRFSTKDDKRRLIAAPYIRNENENGRIGIENHLNYIYGISRELSEHEAIGLSALLNSHLFDLFFRTFNGNINVSATELREFPLPEMKLIRQIGKEIAGKKEISRSEIDKFVNKKFRLSIDGD
jgi:adenine-specific DNA-methyltransferase